MDIALDVKALAALHPPPSLRLHLADQSLLINDQYGAFAQVFSPQRNCADIRLVASHPDVYEPCDDSFALVDALLSERTHLRELQPSVCVEVGSGSGYVITSLALMLGNETNNVEYIATDSSEEATKATLSTLRSHRIFGEVFVTDLVSGLEERLAGRVDVLIFNPPYVSTCEEEVGLDGITSAWAGGDRGRTVIDRMLMVVDMLLSSKGLFYLVTITDNNPAEICQMMRKKGFESRIVIQRYTDEESLHVLKFWRETTLKEYSTPRRSRSPSSFLSSTLQGYLSQCLSRFITFKE